MVLLTVCLVLGVLGYGSAHGSWDERGYHGYRHRKPPVDTKPVNPHYGTINCPSGMAPYSGHCYVSVNVPKTFDDANAYCRVTYAGSTLVSIQSAAENEHVRKLTTVTIWIGGRAVVADQAGRYYWQNVSGNKSCGPTFGFTNWNRGEPNNRSHSWEGPEDCVEMFGDTGKWNDQTCSDKRPFVCKV